MPSSAAVGHRYHKDVVIVILIVVVVIIVVVVVIVVIVVAVDGVDCGDGGDDDVCRDAHKSQKVKHASL